MGFKVPIYLHLFNRSDLARAVFNQIKLVKPEKLYIAADGPRKNIKTDEKRCSDTRKIIEEVDWNCDLKLLFFDENQGSYSAYVQGVSWLFSLEEKAIMLEDDDLPHVDFFKYCEYFLDLYEHDSRIFAISGNNFDTHSIRTKSFFSRVPSTWGWATWARTWNTLDLNYSKADLLSLDQNSKSVYTGFSEREFYNNYFVDRMLEKKSPNWDLTLIYNAIVQGQLTVVPPVNLVKNVGFGVDATHTNYEDPFSMTLPASENSFDATKIEPIFLPNFKYDSFVSKICGPRGIRGYLARKRAIIYGWFQL